MSAWSAVTTAIGAECYCRAVADGAANVAHTAEVLCTAADGDS